MRLTAEQLREFNIPPDAQIETWDNVIEYTRMLGAQIVEFCKPRTVIEVFNHPVVLPRGGYYQANILARAFGYSSTDILHMALSTYKTGKTKRTIEFEYGQMPTMAEVIGNDLIVLDEVCDTGHTLQEATRLLEAMKANSVKTAVMHYKPAKSETGFVPDFYVAETDKWIVYPWEPYELLGAKALEQTIAAP